MTTTDTLPRHILGLLAAIDRAGRCAVPRGRLPFPLRDLK